ncbi:hypothetical protein K9M42_03250 [Patescibacteria group bacterium]|nr:hypothetical protein [Patescibacteria group bacterium]
MINKEYNINDIVNREKDMFFSSEKIYGEYFVNAMGSNNFLNSFILSINDPEKFISVAFLSQIRKFSTLSILSAVRRHYVQSSMNLRQVLEAVLWMIYAMAFKEDNKFCVSNGKTLKVPKTLGTNRNKWIEKEFPEKSKIIKNQKNNINESVAHSNIIYAYKNFKFNKNKKNFSTPFFDFEDETSVKSNLWTIANEIMGIIDFIYGANKLYNTFKIMDNFNTEFQILINQNNKLKLEIMNSERFKKTFQDI